jgi:hypothetical protein
MVAIQVAIAVAVVFGAVVACRAFVGVLNTPLGFSTDRVVTIAGLGGRGPSARAGRPTGRSAVPDQTRRAHPRRWRMVVDGFAARRVVGGLGVCK